MDTCLRKAERLAHVEEHNREYVEETAEYTQYICDTVIDTITKQYDGYVEMYQERVGGYSMEQWKMGRAKIKNRVTKALGLVSKYGSDGSLRRK